MTPIIPPVEKNLLKAELTPERRLRGTNKAGNEIYIVTFQQAPNVMREIGRLREIAFRAAGGGSGRIPAPAGAARGGLRPICRGHDRAAAGRTDRPAAKAP